MKIGKTIIYGLSAVFILNILMMGSFAASSNNSQSIKLNQQFQIPLTSNPSTGYSWNVSYDPKYVKLISQRFVTSNRGNVVGAGGKDIFLFKAIKTGQTTITFKYQRAWEKEPIQTKQYNILIMK